jgi:hypothetical protein
VREGTAVAADPEAVRWTRSPDTPDLGEQFTPVSADTADRRFVHVVAVLSCSHSESTPL